MKLVVAGEAGFVFRQSTTPEKPLERFFSPPVGTPQRSPRLVAKRKRRSKQDDDVLPQSAGPGPSSLPSLA